MPIPSGVETVTVSSGEPLTLPDGTLYRGHIRWIAPDLMVVPTDDYTLGGEAVAELVAGEFSITLVPPDATGISPTGWTYTVIGEFTNAPGWTRYAQLTKNSPTVVLSDILDASATEPVATGIYLPLSGGTMTGPMTLAGDPTTDLQPATKQYVDAEAGGGSVFNLDTGLLWGGDISISLTVGSADIAAGAGQVVDYVSDPDTPVVTDVTIAAQTVAISNLAAPVTWLSVSSAGAIVQQTTRPTNTQRRTHIQLGAVVVQGGALIIDQSLPTIIPQPTNQLYDLMYALGSFNISGNSITAAGANLQLAQETGTVFTPGFNHFVGSTLTNDPHVSSTIAQNPVQIRYSTRTPSAPAALVTNADVANYDLAGVITAIGGGANRATIQRIYLFPTNAAADQIVIQYGQNIYASLDAAVAAIGSDSFVQNPILTDGILLGYLVATRTATALNNTAQARIFMASKFQGGFATASAALALSVLLTGSTMTGPLILSGDPTVALQASTKQYVDNGFQARKPWVFNVEEYGATGDARLVTDGAMASGSTTLTSATAGFTEADEGRSISVKNAGPTGVTTLIAVINTVNSATSATLSVANGSGGAVSNAIVTIGTDDTAAIQAAIDAAEVYLLTHTYAQVYFPPRGYVIAGALNKTKSGNGQLVFGVYAMTNVKKNLEFASDVTGAGAVRTWLQTVPQYGGACLISFGVYASTVAQTADINADGNPGVISGPNEGFGYGVAANYSNIIPVLKNISFLTVHSSFGLGYGAANFFGCANAQLENFSTSSAGVVTGNDYASPGTFGTGLSVGLLLPAPGNNDLVLANNVSIGGGYTYAMFFTEHGLIGRYMALYCWAGLVVIGNYAGSVGSVHAMKILSASIEACINEVYILGIGSAGIGPIIDIDQLSTESSTPNVGGQASHMAAARGVIRWTGLFTESGLTHDNPSGIESINAQAISPVRTVTGTTTARVIDRVLKGNAVDAAVTVNLPSAAPNPVVYTIVKIDATANTVTVDPSGAETINGAATKVLSAQWESVTLRSDGANWIAI